MRPILTLLLVASLSSCSFLTEANKQRVAAETLHTPKQFFDKAKASLDDGNYEEAIKQFEALEARFPYDKHAAQAQLEVAYAYYKYKEPQSSIAAANRFIKLHPNHPNVDYAYYLKGLATFNEDLGLLGQFVVKDNASRDPEAARASYQAFKTLLARFPDSRYAKDAAARMNFLINSLALHEVRVAEYYTKRGAHLAAVNRAKYVLEQYPMAAARADALRVMAQGYRALGLTELEQDTLRVLQANAPAPSHPLP